MKASPEKCSIDGIRKTKLQIECLGNSFRAVGKRITGKSRRRKCIPNFRRGKMQARRGIAYRIPGKIVSKRFHNIERIMLVIGKRLRKKQGYYRRFPLDALAKC